MYEVPPKYSATYQRALTGKSPKAAIKAHCLMCCGWQIKEVRLCTAPNCPLFALRERYFAKKLAPERTGKVSSTPETEIDAPSADYRGLVACQQVAETAE